MSHPLTISLSLGARAHSLSPSSTSRPFHSLSCLAAWMLGCLDANRSHTHIYVPNIHFHFHFHLQTLTPAQTPVRCNITACSLEWPGTIQHYATGIVALPVLHQACNGWLACPCRQTPVTSKRVGENACCRKQRHS